MSKKVLCLRNTNRFGSLTIGYFVKYKNIATTTEDGVPLCIKIDMKLSKEFVECIKLPKANVTCRTKLEAVVITKAVMLSEITLAIKMVDNFKVMLITNNLNIGYFHVLLSRLSKTIVKINFNDSAIDSIAKIYKLINKLNNASSKERAVLVKLINVELSSILLELKKI